MNKKNKNLNPNVVSTTVIGVIKDGKTALGADGQVTFNNTVMKPNARKVRKLYNDKILVGFAGATADAFTLFERFEKKLEKYSGNLQRAAIELAKDWRTDKILRRLEAMLIAMDREHTFIISGTGDVIEPDEDVAAIGSGGPYALSAAKALLRYTEMDAAEIALEAMKIAASICVYTNTHIEVWEIGNREPRYEYC